MSLVNSDGLAATIDTVNDVFFYNREIQPAERLEVARSIASHQGLPGSYADMFGPMTRPLYVFTGEAITSGAACSHILGEECCRALLKLDVSDETVRQALSRATAGIAVRVSDAEERYWQGGPAQAYCCGKCSCAFWRHLAVGGIGRSEERLQAGMTRLNALRSGDGQWRSFPWWYTLLVLSELDLPVSLAELRYAAPLIERKYKRISGAEPFASRRRALAERVLARA